MYKKAIEKDLKQIFQTRRVDFMGVETCLEQDVLCVDVSRVRNGAQEGKAWARVYGSVGIRGTIKKNPAGFLTKKIAQAEPEVLKRFWFAPVEMPASTPTEWELKATKLDFVYFYREEYAPVKGILEYAKMFWDMVVNAIPKNPIDPIPEPKPELPTSNGIDEHTLACWHFDGNKKDEVSGLDFYTSDGTYLTGKFGQALTKNSNNYTVSTKGLVADKITASGDCTVDFWVNHTQLSTSEGFVDIGGNGYWGVRLGINSKKGKVSIKIQNTEKASATYAFAVATWYLISLQKKGNIISVFINGVKVLEYDATAEVKLFTGVGVSFELFLVLLDEARISNVARYDVDFTPPEKPYSA